ncbi:CDP-alcohol phosphatidyltransferase family protein [Coriobacteriales bacterium OH1046]|nr:CDP-alcohol phosphatidyltransferase family protein [Coriobacteriales bacterium OH1046]
MDEQKSVSEQIKRAVDPETAQRQLAGEIGSPTGTADNPSDELFTLANFITLCRFILTLFFLFLFPRADARPIALACYIIAAATDFLDGQVARRTHTVSWAGKVMDPIMDRVLLFTGVIGLVMTDELPLWIALVIVGRDICLAGGAIVLQQYQRRPVDVIFIGKLATALLMFGFGDTLIGRPVIGGLSLVVVSWLPGLNSQPAVLGIFFIYAGLAFSLLAAVVYFVKGIRIIREKSADEG